MALFFGGNQSDTSLEEKIEQATDASQPSVNEALIREISDIIEKTENGPSDAAKAIKKLLNTTKNFTTIFYTLTLLGKLYGRKEFWVLVCNREFIQELVKLIEPKNNPPLHVQQKVLELIKTWATAFQYMPEMNGVCQVYNELKQKGVEFPETEDEKLEKTKKNIEAFQMKKKKVENINSKQTRNTDFFKKSYFSSKLTSDQLNKLTSELKVVEGNMAVLSEMLSELVPGKEPPSDVELMEELYVTCQAMQDRLMDLIIELANYEITGELLRVNDGLNSLFVRYNRYKKNKKSVSTEEGALIDFSSNDSSEVKSMRSQVSNMTISGTTVSDHLKSIPSVSAQNQRNILDIPNQLEELEEYTNKKSGGSGGPSGDSKVAGDQSKYQVNMHMEQDFNEMAAWLGEKDESLTSSEFEKFLAERAAAAETLPSSSSASGNQESSSDLAQRKQKKESPLPF